MARAELSLGAFFAETRGRGLRALIRRRGRAPVRTIADVGSGDGAVLFETAAGGVRVICVDIDHPRLVVGAAEARRRALPMAHIEADARRLPIATGSCDVVVLFEMIQTVPMFEHVVAEASRILVSGGWLIVTAPNPHSPITIVDDPHHHLPFAQQLPAWLAKRYVHLFGRRMPSLGEAFRFPRWQEFEAAFALSGLDLELESMLLLKLSDPDFVVAGWKRPLARAMRSAGFAHVLDAGALSPLRRVWDRHLARSWLLLGWKK